jgi:hypothetical protein
MARRCNTMGWETRKGRGRYYTRSRRVRGRVVREYVGCGELASLAAQLDALEREERNTRAAALRTYCERADTAEEALGEFSALVDALAEGALLAGGYHQHHGGEWRRKRDGGQETRP